MLGATVLAVATALLGSCGQSPTPPSEPRGPTTPALRSRPATQTCLAGHTPGDEPPRLLSETRCYADLATLEPAADVVPFFVRSPLFSDGTHKLRYLALPPGAKIGFTATGAWDFPVGSIMIKTFQIDLVAGDATTRRNVETRIMVRAESDWTFYSYQWNDAQTDAELLADNEVVPIRIDDGVEPFTLEYLFPDRDACAACHGNAPGVALGPRTDQLNMDVWYDGERMNQLEAFAAAGLFDVPAMPAPPEALPALPNPLDEEASLADRARSYLHANCAHCHQPGGWAPGDVTMDMRFELPLEETHLCNVSIQYPVLAGEGMRIAPGDPDASVIVQRMESTGFGNERSMPPIGRVVVDHRGMAVVREWIASLRESDCPTR